MINFYLTNHDPVHDRVIKAMYEGCPEEKQLLDVTKYEPSDVAVVFGVEKGAVAFSKHRGNINRWQKAQKKQIVVMETGYIKRGQDEDSYYAAGFNDINGNADFRNYKVPSDRWEKLGVEMKPWSRRGDYILLCGQVPWDASVQHTDHIGWLSHMVSDIRKFSDREIIFRPHPLGPKYNLLHTTRSNASLDEDLSGAFCCVTFNSNAGVDAVLHGIPVFAFDRGSMVDGVANRNVIFIEDPKMPDRTDWANSIAYAQWTLDEMREGQTWAHLFR